LRFLENILAELRHHGLVNSKRGADGGYWLARDPTQISLAETIRAVEGPLASVRGEPAEEISYGGVAESLQDVWIALRGGVRTVLDSVSLADVASGELPADVVRLSAQWRR
jgi:Rrf2 family protein